MTHLKSVDVLSDTRSRWTVKAPLGQEVSWEADLTADEPGDWPFHCHLLYHMEAGMMREVQVDV